MPNRTARVRHLTLVPDTPTAVVPHDAGPGPSHCGPASLTTRLVLDVELDGTEARVWRRVRVRSDLLLPELHGVLAAALGWPPEGDYEFWMVDEVGAPTYRPGFDRRHTASGDGPSGRHVRIDSLLTAPGKGVRYAHHAGWSCRVHLILVDTDVDDLRPRCLDGSGWPHGSPAATFPPAPVHRTPGVDARSIVESANTRLDAVSAHRSTEVESAAASQCIAGLFDKARSAPLPRLLDLLPRCELIIESSVDPPVAQSAMSKLSWFLGRIGEHGIRLTDSGCLPATVVDAIRDELDWGIGWHGAGSDEIDHHQARDLREAVRDLGLARVRRGMLLLTKVGARIQEDHTALWHHCAARLPLGRREYETDAGTLFLVALAASASPEQRDAMLIETMHGLRWGIDTLDAYEVQKAAHPTVAFLDLIGAHGPLYYLSAAGGDSPSWARRFARDALRT